MNFANSFEKQPRSFQLVHDTNRAKADRTEMKFRIRYSSQHEDAG